MYDRSTSNFRRSTDYRRKNYNNRTISSRRNDDEEETDTIANILIKQFLISCIIVVVIFMIKTVNTNNTNNALNVIKKNINYNVNINKEKKDIYKFIKKISKNSKINIFKIP